MDKKRFPDKKAVEVQKVDSRDADLTGADLTDTKGLELD